MERNQNAAMGIPLLLFVAGDNASSLSAYGNIHLALEMFAPDAFLLDVINVWEFPDRAFEARVLVTPTLLVPSRSRRLVGDLSKWSQVHEFLQSLSRR